MLALSTHRVMADPARARRNPATKTFRHRAIVVHATYVPAENVPSPEKRSIMNLLVLGAVTLPVSNVHSIPHPTCMALILSCILFKCRLLPWVGLTCPL